MENRRQDRFERDVILESELGSFYDSSSDMVVPITIDCLSYNTLSDLQMERGRYYSPQEKEEINTVIWERMALLTKDEMNIAIAYFIEGKTHLEISKEIKITPDKGRKNTKQVKRYVTRKTITEKIQKIKDKLKLEN